MLFGSFLVGHVMGPVPMRTVEVVLGGSGALLVGFGLAGWFARRSRERGARGVHQLREGSGRKRVVVFEGYVTVDDEIVLAETVHRRERGDGSLLVRYEDPVAAGPLIREWQGAGRALDAVADALTPAAQAAEATGAAGAGSSSLSGK